MGTIAEDMEMVALRNGTKEPHGLIKTISCRMEELVSMGTIGICALNELLERCKDESAPVNPEASRLLRKALLLDREGGLHGSVRNIVLSAALARTDDFSIGSPLLQAA